MENIDTGVIGQADSASAFFISWGVFLALLAGLASTDAGKRITYYTLWLLIILVIVTHAPAITGLFTQGGLLSRKQEEEILGNVQPPSVLH